MSVPIIALDPWIMIPLTGCDIWSFDSSIEYVSTPPLLLGLVHVNELCTPETIEKQAR
jgi:hypothetical protein